uniref:Uncharacterized protein n=1 Tax=Romanomermis culicivorax TaxID=13658 RepID=A0A915JIG3_ROMCU
MKCMPISMKWNEETLEPPNVEPVVARTPYGHCFVWNDSIPEATTFCDGIRQQHLKLLPHLFNSMNIWSANRVANKISPILYYFWLGSFEQGGNLKSNIPQHLEHLRVDDKVVKRIIGEGPMPLSKRRNEIAMDSLMNQEPHGVSSQTTDDMYNCFDIVPIIIEDSRGKWSAKGDNISIDNRYDNNCWFFETTRCP